MHLKTLSLIAVLVTSRSLVHPQVTHPKSTPIHLKQDSDTFQPPPPPRRRQVPTKEKLAIVPRIVKTLVDLLLKAFYGREITMITLIKATETKSKTIKNKKHKRRTLN